MILFPIPDYLIGLDLPHGAVPANFEDKETDQSLSGPLAWTETDIGFLTWMSLTQASARSSGRGSSPIFSRSGFPGKFYRRNRQRERVVVISRLADRQRSWPSCPQCVRATYSRLIKARPSRIRLLRSWTPGFP